jgi:hypothetical protein
VIDCGERRSEGIAVADTEGWQSGADICEVYIVVVADNLVGLKAISNLGNGKKKGKRMRQLMKVKHVAKILRWSVPPSPTRTEIENFIPTIS